MSLFVDDFADDSEHFFAHERFRNGATGAEFAGEFQIVGVAVAAAAGHGDDFDAGSLLAKFDNRLKTLFLRHYDVGNDQSRVFFAKKIQSLDSIARGDDVVARSGKRGQDQLADSKIVLNHQDLIVHTGRVAVG